jgi:hypothetical protein
MQKVPPTVFASARRFSQGLHCNIFHFCQRGIFPIALECIVAAVTRRTTWYWSCADGGKREVLFPKIDSRVSSFSVRLPFKVVQGPETRPLATSLHCYLVVAHFPIGFAPLG